MAKLPKVKPLMWGDWGGGMKTAETPFGKYNLNYKLRLLSPAGHYTRHETESAALAYAQTDYEGRILDALDIGE